MTNGNGHEAPPGLGYGEMGPSINKTTRGPDERLLTCPIEMLKNRYWLRDVSPCHRGPAGRYSATSGVPRISPSYRVSRMIWNRLAGAVSLVAGMVITVPSRGYLTPSPSPHFARVTPNRSPLMW